jgi:hypothetical protein
MKTVNMGSSAYSIPVTNDSAAHTSFDDLSVPFHTSAPIPHGESNGNRPDFFEGYKSAADEVAVDFNGYSEKEERDQINDEAYKQWKSKTPLPEHHGPETKRASIRGEHQNEHDMNDSTGPTGKKFTESLHERKPDGKFEETTKKSKVERSGDD